MTRMKSSAPDYPDASTAGSHLVVDKREWEPGEHPEPHLRERGRTGYIESYFRCLRCGAEALRKSDLPEDCDPLTSR